LLSAAGGYLVPTDFLSRFPGSRIAAKNYRGNDIERRITESLASNRRRGSETDCFY
jgi:hypothetical protein